jgi:hypothetical protein
MKLIILLAVSAALGAFAGPAAAADKDGSNWAGYVASAPHVSFTSVGATWVVPAVSCTPGSPTYMSSWVGLGGDVTAEVEQIGTEADCDAGGLAAYSAWLELVPTVSAGVNLELRPGDVIAASVAVRGHRVRLRLADQTTGVAFARDLTARSVDVGSAEWVVEPPAVCAGPSPPSCHASVLSSFGSVGFSRISATAAGHTGGVRDPHWTATAYSVAADGGARRARSTERLGATPSALSGGGRAFSVTGPLAARGI